MGDAAGVAVGAHGAAAFDAAGRQHHEAVPALQGAQRQTIRLQEGVALVQRPLIGGALGGGEIDMHRPDLKIRQHVARQLFRALAVDDGADQVGQVDVLAVAAFRGGGQAQPVRRERKFGDDAVKLRREVVRLVEDQQPKAVAQPLDVAGGGIVSRYRERLRFVVATADQPDFVVREGRPQQRIPLLHQIQGRDHDQPVPLCPAQRQQPNQSFTGSGR